MTDASAYQAAQQRFGSFGLDGAKPAWSSHVLQQAFDESSAEAAFLVVFEIFGDRTDLEAPLAQFIRELVRVCVRLRGADLGGVDLTWMANHDSYTPSQAFLATYLLSDDLISATTAIKLLEAVDETAFFAEVVTELQDVLTSPTVAPVLATRAPELARRIRDTF